MLKKTVNVALDDIKLSIGKAKETINTAADALVRRGSMGKDEVVRQLAIEKLDALLDEIDEEKARIDKM
jgi:hypothetical protein